MKIFDPIQIKNVIFKNRVVMAPMVPFGMPALPSGAMSSAVLQHYLQRVPNEIGLIILQALSVTSKKSHDGGVGVYSDEHTAYLTALAKASHDNGSKLFAQLAYPSKGYQQGDSIHHFSAIEMEEIKDEFVSAAKHCWEAGCDGVELHGAHGFFLNSVVSPLANKRTDQYGGGLTGRLLLVSRIVKEIKVFADDNFIISYRMGWNDDLADDIQTAQALEALGIELLHISSGIPADRKLETPADFLFNEIVYTGVQVKKNIHIPVTVVNGIQTLNQGNRLLENKLCDFVAYGRPFLADKLFLKNSLDNFDYAPCYRCKTCQWFINGEKCPAKGEQKRPL